MELIFNLLTELQPVLFIALGLWIGAKNWDRIDKLSRKLFGFGLDEE